MDMSEERRTWPRVPIGCFYDGLYDGPHATPRPSDSGPIFLGIGNITEDGHLDLSTVRQIDDEDFPRWTKRVEPRAGDIVFVYEAALHRYAIIPAGFRGCLGRRLALIRPDPEKADGRFLFYYFFGDDWRRTVAKHMLSGATVDRIPLTDFPTFEVGFPPLPTQRKIAAMLSGYDDLIENNTRRIGILEELARLLYGEWFVEFRFPGHESVAMVDSALGPMPQGWEIKQVGEIATLSRGRSYASSNLVKEGGMPFLNLKCIDRGGGFRSEGIKFYEGPYKDGQTAKPGVVIIAVTDMTQERRIVAHAARVPRNEYPLSVLSMDLVKLLPKEEIPEAYLYAMLRYSDFSDEVKEFANGANVLHLNPQRVLEYEFPLPSPQLRHQYGEFAETVYQEADALSLANENLRRTRDLLLPKLISGELNVEDLDIEVGELSE